MELLRVTIEKLGAVQDIPKVGLFHAFKVIVKASRDSKSFYFTTHMVRHEIAPKCEVMLMHEVESLEDFMITL